MSEWYFQVMGQIRGPFSASELRQRARSGEIEPDTWVRKDLDGEWTEARRLKGLFGNDIHAPSTDPPGTPKARPTLPPPGRDPQVAHYQSAGRPRLKSRMRLAVGASGAIALIAVSIAYFTLRQGAEAEFNRPPVKLTPEEVNRYADLWEKAYRDAFAEAEGRFARGADWKKDDHLIMGEDIVDRTDGTFVMSLVKFDRGDQLNKHDVLVMLESPHIVDWGDENYYFKQQIGPYRVFRVLGDYAILVLDKDDVMSLITGVQTKNLRGMDEVKVESRLEIFDGMLSRKVGKYEYKHSSGRVESVPWLRGVEAREVLDAIESRRQKVVSEIRQSLVSRKLLP